ncbi:hypothetical protein [Sphingobacterium sp. LRF_L2]|uniref:hypothetical protein n=1 Tax=Sphingobacterium sp. LRF_L2 TaxID=3369421 RepID=UPI003F5D7A53
MDLKSINIQEKTFKANGKLYYIEPGDISIDRYAKYEELALELQYGVSQAEMFANWKQVTQLANELKFSDIAVLANNMQNGLIKLMDRQNTSLKMCTLFINEENEDRTKISDDMISNKINDWREEGYTVGPFFQLALAFSGLIKEISSKLSQESLAKMEAMEKEVITQKAK